MGIWSVRMRASDSRGRHVSGAEGLYSGQRAARAAASGYIARAMSHPKGPAAEVHLTMEELSEEPMIIPALDVYTLDRATEADAAIRHMLSALGVSARAISRGLDIVRSANTMRGAALVDAQTGKRLEPEARRGVRASMLGISAQALSTLRKRLGRQGLHNQTVIEAITLASKVASGPGIVAELCVSDDPEYTTGYVASPCLGYVRIQDIKPSGSASGGRVFFLRPGTSVMGLVHYLEETPAMIRRAPAIHSVIRLGDFSFPSKTPLFS